MKKNYIITDEFVNSRLDRWFKRVVINIPQSLLEKSIRKGLVKVNNKKNLVLIYYYLMIKYPYTKPIFL